MARTTIAAEATALETKAPQEWMSVAHPPAYSRTGRPTDLTPEVAHVVLDACVRGLHVTHCAGLARIHPRRVQDWLEKGEASEDEPYRSFWLDWRLAESLCADDAIAKIRASTTGRDGMSYTHMPWFLQTRFPTQYKTQAATETNVNVTTVQVVGLDRLSGDAMAALVSTLEAKVSTK